MSQIVENWSELRGQVHSVTSAASGVVDLGVRVAEVLPVPGYPNLLAGMAGSTISIRYPLEEQPAPQPGDELHCLVRKAGPDRYFARPTPSSSGSDP